ncbi:MAG: succinate dehydrogenase/fumarate reductase iron-sulfur subunit [Helicobacteraceae bacterium]|jgi:succinate dehydrogenase / fumarate reductase iron-sulfur subunit|nr:succinate dehydrogenase/fumarate reductase iron-sulfur subunit [Helicobacteraceae bacterium]
MSARIVVKETKIAPDDARREIVLRVFRFNAEFDVLPAYNDFALKVAQSETLLDALNRIKAETDATLSYRRSCRHGICGSCAVVVENQAALACKANLFDFADRYGEILTIDPLDKSLAIKDLIVDKTRFWESYRAVSPWLETPADDAPTQENLIAPETADRLNGADACIECGICFYGCPVVAANECFLGPAALTKTYRFVADIRDQAANDRLRFVDREKSGVWDCVKCYKCQESCPKALNPIEKIMRLRETGFERKTIGDSIASRHAKAFKTSIVKLGRLDETANVLESLGFFAALKHIRAAFAMLRKGKIPIGITKIDKLDEVKKLVKSASRSQE